MSVAVVRYQDTHVPAVHAFNERLQAKGIEFRFPERSGDKSTQEESRFFSRELYLALEGDGTVRGGYILRSHPYQCHGKDGIAGHYQLPLSEGIINAAHGMVGVQILLDCLARQPRLYCLGMGGVARPLPVMLKKMGWRVQLIPFFFRIVQPQSFLKEIVFLRQRPAYRAILDILRWTRIGYVGLKAWASLSPAVRTARILTRRTSSREAPDFAEWADFLWKETSPAYEFISLRSRAALNHLYPPDDARFIRLLVEGKQGPLGWAIVMATQMKDHKQFGNMKVGTFVDGLSMPGHEADVVDHAIQALEKRGVDLIVSNQSSSAWKRALRRTGFFEGPSNFAIACSKQLASEIGDLNACHINRGDGDGPIHL